jgi:DNA end-binding protein Ku
LRPSDGDDAEEGYTVIRDALKQMGKVAIGQMVMGGREHLVGIKAHGKGLMLVILRYAHELRDEKPYFDLVNAEPEKEAVVLAAELIRRQSGKFEPKTMPDRYAAAVHEYLQAKVEQRAPEVTIRPEGKPAPQVINIMDALKESMRKQGQAKVSEAVRKRMGKSGAKSMRATRRERPAARGTVN